MFDNTDTPPKKLNEPILNNIINKLIPIILKKNSKNEIIDKIAKYKYNDGKTLYDKCLEEFHEKEKEKLSEFKNKFTDIEKVLKDKENKFIPYETLKDNLNKIINQSKNDSNNNNNEKEKEKEKEKVKNIDSKLTYCLNCLKSGHKNIKKIISFLQELKEEEDKELSPNYNNHSKDNKIKFKNTEKNRKKKKIRLYRNKKSWNSLLFKFSYSTIILDTQI